MKRITTDGNGAVAYVSYAFAQTIIVYPITPSTPMSEQADEWANTKKTNIFGDIPTVLEMQSESGVGGALHGASLGGALSVTYTCSQGLLLLLPTLYKLAGELLPTVLHVSARSIATHALSIFGDHQDVMACRQSGVALLASGSVQEAADLAIVAHLSALKASLPFLHFFDGFRTSHEMNCIEVLSYEELERLLDKEDVEQFTRRALSPDNPLQYGTAQNPDVYFQNREAANLRYSATPDIVQSVMDRVALFTGRRYTLFDYCGAKNAEYIAVIMGSGGEVMEETVKKMQSEGFPVGVIKVRLYRPFSANAFLAALPKTCRRIAVLDRTKEAGCMGEPLFLDVQAAVAESKRNILVIGGRYGLASKEFTPSMCFSIFQNLRSENPKTHFTVGIYDDVSFHSLQIIPYTIEIPEVISCKFYGLGSDGSVGANKNSIKILGDYLNFFTQGYFVYDSRKSGGVTISHLRFGNSPIHSPYLIERADFIACHALSYLTRYDLLSDLKKQGVFLLNASWQTADEADKNLPPYLKGQLAKKQAQFYVIDGDRISLEEGIEGKTSVVMQTAFFLLQENRIDSVSAIQFLKKQLQHALRKKGEDVIQKNFSAIERARLSLHKIDIPENWINFKNEPPMYVLNCKNSKLNVQDSILLLQGSNLPVSAFSSDGHTPTGTMKNEKRGLAQFLPNWITENCIQCNRCSFACPHACIRPYLLPKNSEKPTTFKTITATQCKEMDFRIQNAPMDCTGCGVCADVCPAKDKALVMQPAPNTLEKEKENWDFAQTRLQNPTTLFPINTVKGSQFQQPLFEFPYACAGCGETPYLRLLTQLFGERMLIANATGCSSIYSGSYLSCPYTKNSDGKGPAWANSLFEDNAEFALGLRLASDLKNANRSVWCIGGDGWAYDIGYNGVDHLLASGANVNILVLDSEVYSNTGGQVSKATPLGAIARFAASGKNRKKKNLGLMAMCYDDVYVAQISMGANMQQTLNALLEAESHQGVSLIIAYCPCIAHGIDMRKCMQHERLAVDSGYWHLYRYLPKTDTAPPRFFLDSKLPSIPLRDFLLKENRFRSLYKSNPERAERLFLMAEEDSRNKYALYEKLSQEYFFEKKA